MFYILRKGDLKTIVRKARDRAGSFKELAKKIEIPKSTLIGYNLKTKTVNKENLNKIIKYARAKSTEYRIINELPTNWRQIKGGKNCVKIKKRNGTFESQLNQFRDRSGKGLKKWHRAMKKKDIEEYHKIQYNRFKKVGNYKFKTKKGEKVRNYLEKEMADCLYKKGIKYEYEPFVRVGKKCFFPDFVINDKIIVECTAWRGYDKAIKLKEKIKHLKKQYSVYVLIPKALNRFYKVLDKHLVFETKDVPVA